MLIIYFHPYEDTWWECTLTSARTVVAMQQFGRIYFLFFINKHLFVLVFQKHTRL